MDPGDFIRRNPGRAGRKATPKTKVSVKEANKKKRAQKAEGDGGEAAAPKKPRNNALTRPIKVNEDLAKILGIETTMPRTQVVKSLVAYVKANNLQDPKDGRKIRFTESLEKLFGRKTTTFFQLQKLLGERKLVYNAGDVLEYSDNEDANAAGEANEEPAVAPSSAEQGNDPKAPEGEVGK